MSNSNSYIKTIWEELFHFELVHQIKDDQNPLNNSVEKFRFEVNQNSSQPPNFSIFVQKLDAENEMVGAGIHLRVSDLDGMFAKISSILNNPDDANLKGANGKKADRRLEYSVYSLVHKENIKMLLMTLVTTGKKSESLDIPFEMGGRFADSLRVLHQILNVREISNDDATINDALSYLAIRYREKYQNDVDLFVSKFQETFEKLLKLLGVKNLTNAKRYLESVPFKNDLLQVGLHLNFVKAPILDWILANVYDTTEV